jgi:hypothetical protein
MVAIYLAENRLHFHYRAQPVNAVYSETWLCNIKDNGTYSNHCNLKGLRETGLEIMDWI